MLLCLQRASVEFVLVGAHALAAHGIARATGDIFVRPHRRAQHRDARLYGARNRVSDRLPPRRIDLLTEISGVPSDGAWSSRLEANVAGMQLAFLGKEALIKNKLAAGRDKDLVDAKALTSK